MAKYPSFPTNFISVQEAANKLGISRMAVVKRIHTGKIKAEKIGRSYAIPLSYFPNELDPTKETLTSQQLIHYSVAELAQAVGLSRMAIFKKIKKGLIRAQKIGKRYVIAIPSTLNIQSLEDLPEDVLHRKEISDSTKKKPLKQKEFLSIPELAKKLGITRNQVFIRVKKGEIKATRVGRHYSIAIEELNKKDSAQEFNSPQKDKAYISIYEFAHAIGISRNAVLKRINRGSLPAIKIGRSYAIAVEELEKVKNINL